MARMTQLRLQRAERRVMVARLVKRGLSYRDIHRAMEQANPEQRAPSINTIHHDVKAVEKQLEEQAAGILARARALDLVRLDDLAGRYYETGNGGDADAARVYLSIVDRKGKLIPGYFVATKVEHSGDEEKPVVVEHRGVGLDLAKLSAEELDQIERILAEHDDAPGS